MGFTSSRVRDASEISEFIMHITLFLPPVSAPRELTPGRGRGGGGRRRTSATWNILSSGVYVYGRCINGHVCRRR